MYFLTATSVPRFFFAVRALSCPLEPLQTRPYDPVAHRLVCGVCRDGSATCTVLTPKGTRKEPGERRHAHGTDADDGGEANKHSQGNKTRGCILSSGACSFLENVVARQPHPLVRY